MIEPAATPATPAARFPNGPFIRYMLGEGISMTGTWMQAMAQGWVMAGLTGSSLAIAAVNFAGGLPMLILFRIGGMYADKYDKRFILQACQLAPPRVVPRLQFLCLLWPVFCYGMCV